MTAGQARGLPRYLSATLDSQSPAVTMYSWPWAGGAALTDHDQTKELFHFVSSSLGICVLRSTKGLALSDLSSIGIPPFFELMAISYRAKRASAIP
jgi:hypothetical protein